MSRSQPSQPCAAVDGRGSRRRRGALRQRRRGGGVGPRASSDLVELNSNGVLSETGLAEYGFLGTILGPVRSGMAWHAGLASMQQHAGVHASMDGTDAPHCKWLPVNFDVNA